MFKTSAIHPPPNLLGGGLLAEDDKTYTVYSGRPCLRDLYVLAESVDLLPNQKFRAEIGNLVVLSKPSQVALIPTI